MNGLVWVVQTWPWVPILAPALGMIGLYALIAAFLAVKCSKHG